MRQSRSSHTIIKQEIKEMEIQKLNNNNSKEEAHLSGAYIRNLVKQLSSTNSNSNPEMMSEITKTPSQHQAPPAQQQQQQPHKKQVRRRLHTSRPYQERLLNMAEARREIVTALKFHRASMKQATENQTHNQTQNQIQQREEEEAESVKIKCRRNHRIYPASSSSTSSSSSSSSSSSNIASYNPYQPQYIWPNQSNTITNLPLAMDHHQYHHHQTLANFPLPNQALGLNLNFQDFNNIDFSSATISATASPAVYVPPAVASPSSSSGGGSAGLHAAMDEEAIAEIKSMGEQHEIEWSDTMNLVTSAYWSNLLSPEEDHHGRDHDQFPSWLSAGELTHHLDDSYSSDDYFNNSPSLSSMDIGEIDGMDGDWLA